MKAAILVVDNDETIQLIITMALQEKGYLTAVACDGEEAIRLLTKADFDLIISDVCMPNMNGIQLLEAKKGKGIATPTLFMTGLPADAPELKQLGLNPGDYLKKPIQVNRLISAMESILGPVEKS